MTFDDWYKLYPKKKNRLDAIKAWKQMTAQGFKAEEIIAGLERNLPEIKATPRQFIPYPASWLRAGAWMNEPEDPRQDRYAQEAAAWIANAPQTH